jgi:diguanylate cyclase
MHLNFNALPALIALAILVAVFAAISRHPTQQRVHLWLAGWVLVLLRATVHFATLPNPRWHRLDLSIGLCSLELASIVFVVSVAPKANTVRRQLLLGSVMAVPAFAYTVAMIWDVSSPAFYYFVVALGLALGLLLLRRWYEKITLYVINVSLALVVLAATMVWAIAAGKADYGVHIILAAMNFFAAGIFWYRLRRMSAGVLATVFGFFVWGASFPAAILLTTSAPMMRVDSEIWNIPKYLVAIGMIVTLLEEQILESEHLAYHDALTGLPNRRLLQDRLLQSIAHAARSGRKVAVLLLDLDDFKEVNDTFGHRIGDAALQHVVARLSTRMRAADTLARTGGDEFTVISEVAGPQGAQTLVSALEAALVQPLKVEGRTVSVGVSIGYALYPDDALDPTDLCASADRAMYISKRGSRSVRQPADPAL